MGEVTDAVEKHTFVGPCEIPLETLRFACRVTGVRSALDHERSSRQNWNFMQLANVEIVTTVPAFSFEPTTSIVWSSFFVEGLQQFCSDRFHFAVPPAGMEDVICCRIYSIDCSSDVCLAVSIQRLMYVSIGSNSLHQWSTCCSFE
jgi:hypothetical protein